MNIQEASSVYVLRRIIRRALRHGHKLGQTKPFFYKLVADLAIEMGGAYPELIDRRAYITDRIRREEERFLETLSKGIELLDGEIEEQKAKGSDTLPGETTVDYFGDHVAFDVDAWHRENGLALG